MFDPLDISTWEVLIADDEPDNLRVITFMMEFHHIPARTATTGAECLDQLKRKIPSFLLLDIQMPQQSGYDVLKTIRADESLCKLPVIALTAFAMPGDRERVLEAGFDGYISKPISVLTFFDEVKDILKPRLQPPAELEVRPPSLTIE